MSTLINVCGTARAGTTMLHLMLANGPEAFACGEIYAWFRPWRLNHFRTRCACREPICPIWAGLADSTEQEFHARVLSMPGIDFAVDCSKRISWVLDANRWARKRGIDVHNVVIWKEPLDLAHSYWKRGRSITIWRDAFLEYHRRLLETGLALLSVCYTDLVRAPDAELRALCDATGLPWHSGREEFWTGEHHHLFGSGGVRAQLWAGESSIALDRDFPPEFPRSFAAAYDGRDQDRELEAVTRRLRALAVTARPGAPAGAEGGPETGGTDRNDRRIGTS